MVLQQNYGVNLSKILVAMATLLFLSGCSLLPWGNRTPEPEVKVVTKIEQVQIPIVQRPKPVQLVDTRVYVVNADNLEQFIKEFTEANGDLAFVALGIKDYENLALNIGELRRFIKQQGEVILYYESAVKPKNINNLQTDTD